MLSYLNHPRPQPATRPADTLGMLRDPLLTELWIVALCCLVNGVPGYVHADVAEAIAMDRRNGQCSPSRTFD